MYAFNALDGCLLAIGFSPDVLPIQGINYFLTVPVHQRIGVIPDPLRHVVVGSSRGPETNDALILKLSSIFDLPINPRMVLRVGRNDDNNCASPLYLIGKNFLNIVWALSVIGCLACD